MMEAESRQRTAYAAHFWTQISLDRGEGASLQRQLYERIRDGIVLGLLPAGARLPASRALARELSCSRNTVLEVLGQLIAEDYLTSQRGSGVFVADEMPDRTFASASAATRALAGATAEPDADYPSPALSARGRAIADLRIMVNTQRHVAFSPSVPDVSLFPMDLWMQLAAQEWREHASAFVHEVNPRGYAPLREAIAAYVYAARNVVCSPDQVFVTSGATQGVALAGELLLEPGERAWVEDPGFPVLGTILRGLGADVVPVSLDEHGLNFEAYASDPPRLIAVSPTHQYPTGTMMTAERRLELLAYARRVGAWIVEDDYDSEFRYTGQSLGALAGFGGAASANVIYVGTFTKMMFPAIRLGYLIVPEHLVQSFARGRAVLDVQPSILPQPALARFIADGHLATHLRRMRPIYRHRRDALVDAIRTRGSDVLTVTNDSAGMFLLARFNANVAARTSDVAAAHALKDAGISAQPLSMLYEGETNENGFVLGFACADEATIERASDIVFDVLRS